MGSTHPMRGRVVYEVTVFCAACECVAYPRRGCIRRDLAAEGWRYTRRLGWMCPDHLIMRELARAGEGER